MGGLTWIVLEVGFVGLLVFELFRVRRAMRNDKTPLPPPPRDTER